MTEPSDESSLEPVVADAVGRPVGPPPPGYGIGRVVIATTVLAVIAGSVWLVIAADAAGIVLGWVLWWYDLLWVFN